MRVSSAPGNYSRTDENEFRAAVEREDGRNLKRGQSVELSGNSGDGGPMLVLKSPDGTRYRLLVDNAGALSTVAL